MAVFPVVSGTAANALGLSALVPAVGVGACHETAHSVVNECGSTSLFTSAVTRALPGDEQGRLTPAAVEDAFATTRWGDAHHSQPSVVSMVQPTDLGTIYPVDQLRAVAAVARDRGVRVHVDGARIANAIVALGCTPADLTWRAGVDVLSLGATKNGALSTDAIVCFDPALREPLTYRLKRAGHVASKMRFQSAQLDAYLTDGLWLRLAATANAAMAAPRRPGWRQWASRPRACRSPNMAFFNVPPDVIDAWAAAGIDFYRMADDRLRLVTSFRSTPEEIDEALDRMAAALDGRPRRPAHARKAMSSSAHSSGSSSGMKWPHGSGRPVTGWSAAVQRRQVPRNAWFAASLRQWPSACTGQPIVRPARRGSATSSSLSSVAPARSSARDAAITAGVKSRTYAAMASGDSASVPGLVPAHSPVASRYSCGSAPMSASGSGGGSDQWKPNAGPGG